MSDTATTPEPSGSDSEILLYQTEDRRTQIEVRLEGETVWLSQAQMAELFQTTPQNITIHVKNIYDEGELTLEGTCKEYLQVRREGARDVQRSVTHYNLEVIISVGYRVRSHRGTQFRMWATQRLREFLVKGFTLDDQRLSQGGEQSRYFDELLERVRARGDGRGDRTAIPCAGTGRRVRHDWVLPQQPGRRGRLPRGAEGPGGRVTRRGGSQG